MNRLRKLTAVILTVCLIYTGLPDFTLRAAAAPSPISVQVVQNDSGELEIKWGAVPSGTLSVKVEYHKPDGSLQRVQLQPAVHALPMPALVDDFIYDFAITAYSVEAAEQDDAHILAQGLLYYLTRMTFTSRSLAQEPEAIPGGGKEIGTRPGLKLEWKMPRVWTGSVGDADIAAGAMEDRLEAIYGAKGATSLSFKINISTRANLLNTSPDKASVNVNWNGSGYTASVASSTADIKRDNGYLSVDLIGARDTDTAPVLDPDPNISRYQLRDGGEDGILPGTVYYMNIVPVFKAGTTPVESLITVGAPEDYNGSPLSGTPYAFTPTRFQLTRHDQNIYAKVYKVNQGSLDLPQLYYEVQAASSLIPGDWPVTATLNSTQFANSEYAPTVLNNVNPLNLMYYRVVVKSNSSTDRLISLPLPYVIVEDTSRPPVVSNVRMANRVPHTLDVARPAPAAGSIQVNSSDITLSWDKPTGWDSMTEAEKADIFFNIRLSTSQTDRTQPAPIEIGDVNFGNFAPGFRLSQYVAGNLASPTGTVLKENGSRLEYTLKADGLFKGINADGIIPAAPNIDNPDQYPTFLLPNTTYYVQMYTTRAKADGTPDPDRKSDFSITSSFTTLPADSRQIVPLVQNLQVDKNNTLIFQVSGTEVESNNIELLFDKITTLNWGNYTSQPVQGEDRIYYDVYMSNGPGQSGLIRIGSTDPAVAVTDAAFEGADIAVNSAIRVRINRFSDLGVRAAFGESLRPNTTYYFQVRTRLVPKNAELQTSDPFAPLLPVTTVTVDIEEPDPSQRTPLTPTDFTIAVDGSGNPMVTGYSAAFQWERKETDVVYELICTPGRVEPDALASTYDTTAEYLGFLDRFDIEDGTEDQKVILDPTNPLNSDAFKFSYNAADKQCRLTINTWLFPNRLYYFSVRAIVKKTDGTAGKTSPWVSIPVTTLLLEAPKGLEAVHDYQVGFNWTDRNAGTVEEDYEIHLKGPGEAGYTKLNRSQYTIVKDGSTFYGRVFKLKSGSTYSIQVRKGTVLMASTLEKAVRGSYHQKAARDGYHQVEVKWTGILMDGQTYFELAVKAETDSEYTVLNASDYELYPEESLQTAGDSQYKLYHARIKTISMRFPDGSTRSTPLKSNTRYSVKVRTVKRDMAISGLTAYSVYKGPVDTRTEFNQDDYDREDEEEKKEALFLDRIGKLEEGLYWIVENNLASTHTVLLKGDKVINALRNGGRGPVAIDISNTGTNISTHIIYIPLSIIRQVNTQNKTLVIKARGAEYTLRPRTIDDTVSREIREVQGKAGVRDLMLKVTLSRAQGDSASALPANTQLVSDIHALGLNAGGNSRTDTELQKLWKDKLYNNDTGLVRQKINLIKSQSGVFTTPELLEAYVNGLVTAVEMELARFIGSTLSGIRIAAASAGIARFSTPLLAKLYVTSSQGTRAPYVSYEDSGTWQRLTNQVTVASGTVSFDAVAAGKFAVLRVQPAQSDDLETHWANDYFKRFQNRYDLDQALSLQGQAFNPDALLTVKEAATLYETITGAVDRNTGMDLKQKVKSMGLDGILNASAPYRELSRQEAAALVMDFYCRKTGLMLDGMQPGRRITMKDETKISDRYYRAAEMAVDLGLMTLSNTGYFLPDTLVTRADMVAAVVLVMDMTDR